MAANNRSKLIIYPAVQYPVLFWAIGFGVITAIFTAAFAMTLLETGYLPIDTTKLALMAVAAVLIYAYLLAFFTNRLFGPLYHLHKAIRAVADGETPRPVELRPGDQFHDVASDFNRLLERFSKSK